jgi:Kef-type K+ transport system membrane component KefB
MEQTFAIAALWFGLALLATFLGTRIKVSNALMEIVVGIVAGAVATHFLSPDALGAKLPWLTFVASAGAVVLTFLAGAELDPRAMRAKWKEVLVVGMVSFGAPFLGCAAIARFILDWRCPARPKS